MRPVTLVGYEEGPHPLMSGKAVENQLAIYSCDKVAVVSVIYCYDTLWSVTCNLSKENYFGWVY